MRKRVFFVLFVSFLVSINCSCISAQNLLGRNTNYKIKRIDENDCAYIIDATRNDTIFRIISTKMTDNEVVVEGIKIGESYLLKLRKVYPSTEGLRADTAKINFRDSCFIITDKSTHYSLYIAENLNGIGLTENIKSITEIVNNIRIYSIDCDACKERNNILIRLFVK